MFEEHGWEGDLLYPGSHACTFTEIPANTANPKKNQEHKSHHSAIGCSLNEMLQSPIKTEFNCNSSTLAPLTKQAVLCGGRSALAVALQHPDLEGLLPQDLCRGCQGKRLNAGDGELPAMQLEVVREPSSKVVLALETSSMMAEGESWRWIHKAAHRFLRHQLPVNSALALITFSGRRVTLEQPLIQVTSQAVRARLADTIPGKYHLSEETAPPCIACVVKETVETVVRGREGGTHLVLVTAAGDRKEQVGGGREDLREALALATNNSIKVSTIILHHLTTPQDSFKFNELSSATRGRSWHMSQLGLNLLLQLNTALDSLVRQAREERGEAAETIHIAELITSEGESWGEFTIDPTLGRDTMFSVYVEDEEDHLVESVTFHDNQGVQYGPFTKMSSRFDRVNMKTINFLGREPPFGDRTQLGRPWRYAILWSRSTSACVRKSLVTVTSKPRSKRKRDRIRIAIWTSDNVLDSAQTSFPLATVVVRVLVGKRPVLNATVALDGTVRLQNGSTFDLPQLALLDDGRGVPDIVKGDGLYSAQLPPCPGRCLYHFQARVSCIQCQAYTIKVDPGTRYTGSQVVPGPDALEPSLDFTRMAEGESFTVVNSFDNIKVDSDTIAPAKVVDLRVESSSLVWSSPGGDYLSGSSEGYQVLVGSPLDLLRGEKERIVLLFSRDVKQPAGSVNKELLPPLTTSLPSCKDSSSKKTFVGVQHLDSNGNIGPISNLVAVELANLADQSELVSVEAMVGRHWLLVGILCGAIGVLLVITAVSLAYFCHVTRARNARVKGSSRRTAEREVKDQRGSLVSSSGSSEQTDNTSFELDLPRGAFSHVDLKDFSSGELSRNFSGVDMKNLTPSSPCPSQRGTTPPIYWSASQLLSKLGYEEGGREIPEEFTVTVSDLHYRDGWVEGQHSLPRSQHITQV